MPLPMPGGEIENQGDVMGGTERGALHMVLYMKATGLDLAREVQTEVRREVGIGGMLVEAGTCGEMLGEMLGEMRDVMIEGLEMIVEGRDEPMKLQRVREVMRRDHADDCYI